MQRLTSPPLVPSSMSAGNVIFSNALAMTAPGSSPVDPLPEPVDPGAGLPRPESSESLPVNTTSSRWRTGSPGGSSAWVPTTDSGIDDATGGWRQL